MSMENSSENIYLVDLSYAKCPADIVYELSTIIEQEMAWNQNILLKLGSVDLNQSQLLSIKSLINSIHSNLAYLNSESKVTELAAITIGLVLAENKEPESAETQEPQEPSTQYVAMTDHLEEDNETAPEENTDVLNQQESSNEESIVIEEVEEETATATEAETETEKIIVIEETIETIEVIETSEKAEESVIDTEQKTEQCEEDVDTNNQETNEAEQIIDETSTKNDEIQAELDSIFDSEMKLENILGKQNQNYPQAKEAADIELPEEEELTEEDFAIRSMPTKYIKQTVRSGQVIKFEGNLVIIGDCHPGSEIHAEGDITVWGTLGGIAQAGFGGNHKARIRALQLNAIQLRIGESFARRPDMHNIPYLDKSNTVAPEEARIINNNIVILKLND